MVWGVFDWPETTEAKSEEGSEGDYPECDYDSNLTPLYEAIEERAWIAVNQFLHSGYWPESLFADPMTPEEQARTWVTRYETRPDGSKKVRWSQLPIHAAVIFGAPSVVIQQLVECFPQSVRCTDDHRMLPLHLAFRHGSDDSVLALFLEEFPEAVNVRGYKGRLPVECAIKGPNPERGAIIQTILSKNQSVWERKKSAVQLKELYCIKEALKIKSQKVSHLETAIREIKSREHKTRKELSATMTELKAAKIKSKDHDAETSTEDKTAERMAVKALVEKLAALEMATKDLVDKEKATRKELNKTRTELENARNMKPTDDQVDHFAQLEKVSSKEEDKLDRVSSKVSFDDREKESQSPKSSATPVSILKKTDDKKDTASVASKKSTKSKDSKVSALTADTPAVASSPSPVSSSSPVTSKATRSNASSGTPAAASAEAAPCMPEIVKSQSRELEQHKLQETKAENEALTKKIKELEAQMQINKEKTAKKQEELEAASVPDQNNNLSDQQTETMAALQAEMKALRESSQITKVELSKALQQLSDLKASQDERFSAAIAQQSNADKEVQEHNKKLEKKVALLELALKQFEEKSEVAKTEMQNIKDNMEADKTVKLTPAQERYMAKLEDAIRKIEKNEKKTKKELETALTELEATKAKERANAALLAAAESQKFNSLEETNKALEAKIAMLESTMKGFEDKASKTKEEMQKAMQDLKASDASTVASGESLKLTKKQKQHMQALENAMKKLEDRATNTKQELDAALEELTELKKTEAFEVARQGGEAQKEAKALKDLAKKVQALQSAMVGFEVKETRTIQELEKAMMELADRSNKRFEVLQNAATKTEELVTDPRFTKDVDKLEKKAMKEEKRLAELEMAVQDIITKSGNTKEELERTQQLLAEVTARNDDRGEPETKEEKEESKQDKKLIKDLTKKVATLQSAVIGFEVKETRTMKELENTMKQLEELTSKRFEVLEKAAAMKERDTERLAAAGALAEEKVAALHAAMQELERNAAKTHEELEQTKLELETMKTAGTSADGINKKVISSQENQIKELNEKIAILQQAVVGFEVKETKTMQELEQTMKQLEELTAKRFEVLQKVAGREIEAAKAAEADKYNKKAAQEEKKVEALEFAMRELEAKAYKTKLELERTMKTLEDLEGKQQVSQEETDVITKEEKHVMRELVSKVADIQEAVMAYDEKELKTAKELESTKAELEATRKEVEMLRARHTVITTEKKQAEEVSVISRVDSQSQAEAFEVQESEDASVTAKRVTEETLTSLESAIHRLVETLGEDEQGAVAEKLVAAFSKDEREKPASPVASAESSVTPTPASAPDTDAAIVENEAAAMTFSGPTSSSAPQNLMQAASTSSAPANPPKKKRSLFGRLSVSSKGSSSKKETKKDSKNKKVGFGAVTLFGFNKKSGSKTSQPQQERQTTAIPVPAVPTPVVTAEQRKAVEAIHGTAVTSVLSDQQILDLFNKIEQTPATQEEPAVETVPSVHSAAEKSTGEESAAKSTGKGSVTSNTKSSVVGSGMKEEDPHMMVVSLPSQRVSNAEVPASSSMKSQKSTGSNKSQKSNKSHKSQKSNKSAPASSPRSKAGSISPAPIPSNKTDKSATSEKPVKSDVLIAAGTYDDGFEINF